MQGLDEDLLLLRWQVDKKAKILSLRFSAARLESFLCFAMQCQFRACD